MLGPLGLKKDTYEGFPPEWYMDVGKSICLFLFTSSLISNSQDLKNFGKKTMYQLFDRSLKINLKKDPEDDDDDEPNTKKKL